MQLEEIKMTIEKQTGIPAALLNGETAQENIALARAYLKYKAEQGGKTRKTPREQFYEWMNVEDEKNALLSQIEAELISEVSKSGTGNKSTREQFAEWMRRS